MSWCQTWIVWSIAVGCSCLTIGVTRPAQADEPSLTSCFTASCHNGEGKAIWNRSALIWLEKDPHAHAYNTLLSNFSREIVGKLQKQPSSSPLDEGAYRAFLQKNCTSCHATNPAGGKEVLGVECQSCHGTASAWNEKHWSAGWKAQGASRFDPEMVNTDSLVQRATVCSSCHVGDVQAGREVDHELMAAGHPPLLFRFDSYYKRLPAHWDRGKDEQRFGAPLPYLNWRVGKLVHASSRFKQFTERSKRKVENPHLAWPELTEFSCYDCHHELKYNSSRKGLAGPKATWDAWSLAELDQALVTPISQDFSEMVKEFRKKAEGSFSDTEGAAALASKIELRIRAELPNAETSQGTEPDELRKKLARLLETGPRKPYWEHESQWFAVTKSLADSLSLPSPPVSIPEFPFRSSEGTPSGRDQKEVTNDTKSSKSKGDWLDSPANFEPGQLSEFREKLQVLVPKGNVP